MDRRPGCSRHCRGDKQADLYAPGDVYAIQPGDGDGDPNQCDSRHADAHRDGDDHAHADGGRHQRRKLVAQP